MPQTRAGLLLVKVLAIAAALVFAAPGPSARAESKPAREGVATENRLTSQAALTMLRAGGTAADAAVTAALVAGVVAPTSSGLGGGGFALVFDAKSGTATVLDFRETAPAALDPQALERRPLPAAERGQAVGVPGEALGLAELHRRFGKRPWREVVAPAERLARQGFAVESHLASVLAEPDSEKYRSVPSLGKSFYAGGKPAVVGTRVTRPKLARTLARLAQEGPSVVYGGPIAQDLVAAARAAGGTLTRDDLASYRVREREPLRVKFEGDEILTMPPPSAGGILLAQVLGSFRREELQKLGPRSPLRVHLVAEAMRASFADRVCCIGDPDFLPIATHRLLAPERIAARRASIADDRTHTVRQLMPTEHGTHALVLADAAGNVVSLTTTVNSAFGADLEGEASGIVLNDELYDFISAGMGRDFGLASAPNTARPRFRPVSSMTPTIVLRAGRPLLALGGSGGMRISPNVTQVLLASLVDGLSPEAAVALPRFRPMFGDSTLGLEAGFSPDDVRDLVARGEKVKENDASSSAVQLLSFGADGVRGGADPRKGGAALTR